MKNLHRKKHENYQARIRLAPHEKIIYRSLGTKNRKVALQRLDELYNRLSMEREGLAVPQRMKEASAEDIQKHIMRFCRDLETVASNDCYVRNAGYRLSKLARECKWTFLHDIDGYTFREWRSCQKLSVKTLNHYRSILNTFMDWMVENGFTESNPISKIKPIPVRGRHKFKRRAFTDAELMALLSIAPVDRQRVYVLAVTTGLRRTELALLQRADIKLDCSTPHIIVRGETTKNGKDAVIYLHPDAVFYLSDHLCSLKPEELVLEVPTMAVFKSDLKKAAIEYENSRFERVDFHAFRYTFCTRLAKSGVSPQVAKLLMRHSDIKLTTNLYTDSEQLGTAPAIGELPSLFTSQEPPQKPPQKSPQTTPNRSDNTEQKEEVIMKLAELLGIDTSDFAQKKTTPKSSLKSGARDGSRTHTA